MALFAPPVGAGQSYPDLKGTWIGTAQGAFEVAPGRPAKAESSDIAIKLVVDRQKDKHFAGTLSLEAENKAISGVIASDRSILWSEPNGFVRGKLVDGDTMEACYVRISAFSQLATCEQLKRQK
jgi:hypothetical protein